MARGRTTTVLTVRLPDGMAARLKNEARSRKMLLNDHLKAIFGAHLKWPSVDVPLKQGAIPENESGIAAMPGGDGIEMNLGKDVEAWETPGTKANGSLPKVGRNAPCPCGAKRPDGRATKYKFCCGNKVEVR